MNRRIRKSCRRLALAALVGSATLPLMGQFIPEPPKVIGSVSGGAPASPMPEPPAKRWPERDRSKGIAFSISPQAEGKPALEFALMPRIEQTAKGNSVVKYLAATAQLPKYDEAMSDLIDAGRRDAPLAELNPQDAEFQKIISEYSTCLRTLREGAMLDGVDWETNVRTEGYRALLPSLGGCRQAANVLALEIRFDIKRHDWAAASDKLRTGFALARRLSEGETLISSLVGTAIAAMLCQTLEDWVAEPGAPNLYWPLANLPTPFSDLRRPLAFERATAYFSFPPYREMKEGRYSADAWTRLVVELRKVSGTLDGNESPGTNTWIDQSSAATLGVLMYPQAKSYLAGRGIPRETIEKMPVYEALERYFVLSYEEVLDDTFKWSGLPPAESWKGMSDAGNAMSRSADNGELNILARVFLPSLGKVGILTGRLDRQIAALRIVEALRIHAAETGSFPPSLEALKLPVPRDPLTANPFNYELAAGKAVLSGPAVPAGERSHLAALRFEITLKK